MLKRSAPELLLARKSAYLSLHPAAASLPAMKHIAIAGAVLAGGILGPRIDVAAADDGIHKIKHVVIIMQENRSFDHYFGTYPGAEGLPAKDGKFTVCVPDPSKGSCAEPFHDSNDRNFGAGHGAAAAAADIDGGKMD